MKRRENLFDVQLDLDPTRLGFVDETGLSTKMSRLRRCAICGERCRSPMPRGLWKRTTFTAALWLSSGAAPMVLDFPVTWAAFPAYVQQVLIPTLVPGGVHPVSPGDIVIIDICLHKRPRECVAQMDTAGCRLLDLSPYSPDVGPIQTLSQN